MLRIKEILKEKNLTLTALSEKLGIHRVTLTQTISGNPTLETLTKIADALDVDIIELFIPRDTEDFTAMINHKGTMKQFDSVKELKAFLDSVNE